MEASDVRQVYDFERDGEDAATRLANYPPLWEGIQWSTGIDCLIVVIRHIYCNSMMSLELHKELAWFKESEARNPILGHAWHMFGREDGEVEKATEDRKKVHKTLLELGILPSESFTDICDSSLMNETFWSQDIFRLTRPPIDATTGDELPLSANEIAELSKLEFKPDARGACIQDVFSNAFGIQQWKGRQLFLVPRQPWVVRVLYHANDNLCDSITIQQLKTLKLPVWDDKKDVEGVYLEEVRQVDYFLSAVVRLGAEGDHPDHIRTYSPFGQNVPGEYQPRLFTNNSWSVANSGTYMLFYCILPEDIRRKDVTGFDEVQPLMKPDEWLEKLDRALEIAKPKIQAGEVGKTATLPVNDTPPPSDPRPSDILDDRLERAKGPPEPELEDIVMATAPTSAPVRISTGQDSDAMDVDGEDAST